MKPICVHPIIFFVMLFGLVAATATCVEWWLVGRRVVRDAAEKMETLRCENLALKQQVRDFGWLLRHPTPGVFGELVPEADLIPPTAVPTGK